MYFLSPPHWWDIYNHIIIRTTVFNIHINTGFVLNGIFKSRAFSITQKYPLNNSLKRDYYNSGRVMFSSLIAGSL